MSEKWNITTFCAVGGATFFPIAAPDPGCPPDVPVVGRWVAGETVCCDVTAGWDAGFPVDMATGSVEALGRNYNRQEIKLWKYCSNSDHLACGNWGKIGGRGKTSGRRIFTLCSSKRAMNNRYMHLQLTQFNLLINLYFQNGSHCCTAS